MSNTKYLRILGQKCGILSDLKNSMKYFFNSKNIANSMFPSEIRLRYRQGRALESELQVCRKSYYIYYMCSCTPYLQSSASLFPLSTSRDSDKSHPKVIEFKTSLHLRNRTFEFSENSIQISKCKIDEILQEHLGKRCWSTVQKIGIASLFSPER